MLTVADDPNGNEGGGFCIFSPKALVAKLLDAAGGLNADIATVEIPVELTSEAFVLALKLNDEVLDCPKAEGGSLLLLFVVVAGFVNAPNIVGPDDVVLINGATPRDDTVVVGAAKNYISW